MFQPCSGTAPSLGSVTNVTSYFSPSHRSTVFFFNFPLHPSWPDSPPPSATLRLICTNLFTRLSPFFQYWDVFPHGQGSTPAGLPRLSLQFLSCRPQPSPQVHIFPCSHAPRARFCRLFPRPVAPLLLPLMSLTSMSTPVGSPF